MYTYNVHLTTNRASCRCCSHDLDPCLARAGWRTLVPPASRRSGRWNGLLKCREGEEKKMVKMRCGRQCGVIHLWQHRRFRVSIWITLAFPPSRAHFFLLQLSQFIILSLTCFRAPQGRRFLHMLESDNGTLAIAALISHAKVFVQCELLLTTSPSGRPTFTCLARRPSFLPFE